MSTLFRLRHILAILMLGLAVAAVFHINSYPAELGRLPLSIRMLIMQGLVVLALSGIQPLLPWFKARIGFFLSLVVLPAMVVVAWYYLSYLPGSAQQALTGQQLSSERITESTSNGIIEIGFAYPIFTPTISLTNPDIFTDQVDVYLRILDGNNEPNLFRAVRDQLPDQRLSVEATVNGLLSENPEYLFIPVDIPPRQTVTGRVVFIISDLNDGSTFDEALGRSYQAEFELREPETGELLYTFPLNYI